MYVCIFFYFYIFLLDMLKLWWEHFIQYISTVNGNYLQQIVQFSLLVFEGDLSFLNFLL